MKHWTYRKAVSHFNRHIKPHYHNDIPAQAQAWCYLVDSLQRGGCISDRQAATWDNPFYK